MGREFRPNRLATIAGLLLLSITAYSKTNFVRVMFHSDASSHATVGWNQISGAEPMLEIDVTPNFDSPQFLRKPVSTSNHSKGMHNHFVRFEDLIANTKYYFRIVDNEEQTRIYYFTTISDNANDPISFIAGGDSRDRSEIRRMGNQIVEKLKPHAVLFNGDFTGYDIPSQWIEWFTDWELTIGEDGRVTPIVVTRGNHELTNKSITKLFDVPHKKVYYETTFGGNLVNIVSLNSEILKFLGQKVFLRQTLKRHADFYWQIPQYHRPIRAHVSYKKEMETEYRNFVPLFEKYPNVRLCLENDSHTCKYTWPVVSSQELGSEEGFIRNDSIGIVYVGEGCWGAPLRTADDSKCWTRDAEGVNQVNWIFVSKEKIEVRTILYECVANVEPLGENNRFTIPRGLELWTPSNGALIEIYPRSK